MGRIYCSKLHTSYKLTDEGKLYGGIIFLTRCINEDMTIILQDDVLYSEWDSSLCRLKLNLGNLCPRQLLLSWLSSCTQRGGAIETNHVSGIWIHLCRGSRHTSYLETIHISMAWCKTAVTPLLTHWSYCSLAPSHRYIIQKCCAWIHVLDTAIPYPQ